jgi:hypothetical protein
MPQGDGERHRVGVLQGHEPPLEEGVDGLQEAEAPEALVLRPQGQEGARQHRHEHGRDQQGREEATMTVKAMSPIMKLKSPSPLRKKSTGANTHTVVRAEPMIGSIISAAPMMAASSAPSPVARRRWMFSKITMEESTIIPMPRMRPEREMLLRVSPPTDMARSVARREIGIDTAMATVARTFRRKKKRTARVQHAAYEQGIVRPGAGSL